MGARVKREKEITFVHFDVFDHMTSEGLMLELGLWASFEDIRVEPTTVYRRLPMTPKHLHY